LGFWGLVLVVCVCVSVSGVLFSVGVCVCDLLIFLHQVEYTHPVSMKEEEEGGAKWSEKRLEQLSFLFEHVGGALKAQGPPVDSNGE